MRSLTIQVPVPCSESWEAMTPAGVGRHCAACQRTVVDFTRQTDAELLAYFQQGHPGTCGRFHASQLGRMLRPALAPATGWRWRVWAALLAVWSLREVGSLPAPAQATAPAQHPQPHAPAVRYLHGVVRDASTGEPLAEVAVFLQGENRHTFTDAAGRFGLVLPGGGRPQHTLVLHYTGYESRTVHLPARSAAGRALAVGLQAQAGVVVKGALGIARQESIVGGYPAAFESPLGLPIPPMPPPQVVPLPVPRRSVFQRLRHFFQQ